MADESAPDDIPQDWGRTSLAGAIAIAVAAIAAGATIEKPFMRLFDILFPYPLMALVAATLAAWIAARLRHAPAAEPGGRLHPWPWVIWRIAIMAANSCLMVAWGVAALIGAPVAPILLEAFVLTMMVRVIVFLAEHLAVHSGRAIRGPAGTAS